MKARYILIFALILLLIIPQIASAVWWNPLTWKIFKRSEVYMQTKAPTVISTSTNTAIDVKSSVTNPDTAKLGTPLKKEVPKNTPPKPTTPIKLTNAEIIRRVKPAVVYIETASGAGSGIIISSDGYILTNAHVVSGINNADVTILYRGTLNAFVVGRDENVDLAVLKVVGGGLTAVSFGDSSLVEQGDDVFTLGYPFGLKGDVSFKEGTISRRINDGTGTYLETSAEIHPGNSGGPLVNTKGQVIGVNTASLGSSVKGVAVGETIKFAIPINIVKELIPELKSGRQIVLPKSPTPVSENPFQNSDSSLKIAKCQAERQKSYNSSVQQFEEKMTIQLENIKAQLKAKESIRMAEINRVSDQNRASCTNSTGRSPSAIISCISDNTYQTSQLMNSLITSLNAEWAKAKSIIEAGRQTFINGLNPILDQTYISCLNK